ncbi:MAG: acetate kinase [Candidatus Aureabacteria bacterium]|nr:acetate kinase [Candidatus Auribacterota bacterium]NLW94937.1 acetate kinase [Chlamydiota bacterium]HQM51694.1 acetate kinase [bacterium]
MKILVLNSGSSSIKYQVFDIDSRETLLAKGLIERIGLKNSAVAHSVSEKPPFSRTGEIRDHTVAIEEILSLLTHPEQGVVRDLREIEGVGHRIVHGGEKFAESVLVDDAVYAAIKECVELAPLHNPPNLLGIEACRKLLPGVPQAAVFDTAFHQTMPPRAYAYAIPYRMYLTHKIRRYGFHGTSHMYVSREAARLLARPLESLKIVTCHLGNGCSVAAVDSGVSVDTSMGFTPLEGLVMGSRSGDLDPYVPLYLMERERMGISEMSDLLNKKSGLVGICGKKDMRDIIEDARAGSKAALLAIEVFTYRVAKYIGAYAAAMNGLDAIVFTAGMGERSAPIRSRILAFATFLGLEVDEEKNRRGETIFSTPRSKVAAMMIPTNEELVIARDTHRLITARARA